MLKVTSNLSVRVTVSLTIQTKGHKQNCQDKNIASSHENYLHLPQESTCHVGDMDPMGNTPFIDRLGLLLSFSANP